MTRSEHFVADGNMHQVHTAVVNESDWLGFTNGFFPVFWLGIGFASIPRSWFSHKPPLLVQFKFKPLHNALQSRSIAI